jgi:hypothetical protein
MEMRVKLGRNVTARPVSYDVVKAGLLGGGQERFRAHRPQRRFRLRAQHPADGQLLAPRVFLGAGV